MAAPRLRWRNKAASKSDLHTRTGPLMFTPGAREPRVSGARNSRKVSLLKDLPVMQLVSRGDVSQRPHAHLVLIRRASSQPRLFAERAKQGEARTSHERVFLHQTRQRTFIESAAAHVIVLFKALHGGLVAPRNPQGPVGEYPLGVADVAEHLLHRPLVCRVPKIAIPLAASSKQLHRLHALRLERACYIISDHQRNILFVVPRILPGFRPRDFHLFSPPAQYTLPARSAYMSLERSSLESRAHAASKSKWNAESPTGFQKTAMGTALGGTASRILRRSVAASSLLSIGLAFSFHPGRIVLPPDPTKLASPCKNAGEFPVALPIPAAPARPHSYARRRFHCEVSRMDLLRSAALQLSSASSQLAAAPFSFHHRARFLAATPIFSCAPPVTPRNFAEAKRLAKV